VKDETPLVIVVYTVGALGVPYTIVPDVWPCAGIVDVYGFAPADNHVVLICVPSGITYSMVPGDPFVPLARVVVKDEAPLVCVVYTVAALGLPKIIIPDVCPCAGIVDV